MSTSQTIQQIWEASRLPVSRKSTRVPMSRNRHDLLGYQLSKNPEFMTQVCIHRTQHSVWYILQTYYVFVEEVINFNY